MFGADLSDLAITLMVALAAGGMVLAVLYPIIFADKSGSRIKAISAGKKIDSTGSWRGRFAEDSKDTRRKQIQESLNQAGNAGKPKKKRMNLTTLLAQSGLDITKRTFWLMSLVSGAVFGVAPVVLGAPIYVGGATAFVGLLGFPRYVLKYMRKRRQTKFLTDFADAVDVMVRGLKSGLPVSETMKIVASESGQPVGPEFHEVVEGQRLGISIDQGIERMVERMPLPEVNFLAIVLGIQAKTGGNLSEALANLSRVLRDRKKMKAKVKSVSQEAKSSAAIIGSLPFIIMGALEMLNPKYLDPLFYTHLGNIILICSGVWMTIGVLVMRKMIQFEI